jgi:metal-responsive CopG/Arc/MetJ family transcriptional regulator
MTDKVTVSVLIEPETLEKLTELQKQHGIFSRSKLLREVIDKGLKVAEKEWNKQEITQ